MSEGHVDVDGRSTWFRTLGTRTERTPLLMLHGGPGGASPDDMVAAGAASRDRLVVAYDQLDCGRSARAGDPSQWTVEAHVAHLAGVRRALGLDEVHLWGQSWGGMLALAYVLTRPQGVRSLTLASAPVRMAMWMEAAARYRAGLPVAVQRALDRCERSVVGRPPPPVTPGPGPTSTALRKDAERMRAMLPLLRHPLAQRLARGASHLPPLRRAVYPIVSIPFIERHLHRGDMTVGFLVQQAGLSSAVYESMWGPSEFVGTGPLRDFDLLDRLGEVDLPVLITSGSHDLAAPDHMRLVADSIRGARWELFDGCGHCAEFEAPERYAGVLQSFLTSVDEAVDHR